MSDQILLADDHRGLRELFAMALRTRGFNCVTVASGEAAVREMKREDFDLVVLDLRMERMSGLEVLRTMRAGNDLTKAVMVSASFSGEVVLEAAALGVTVFLAKPVTLSVFQQSLTRVLEVGRCLREPFDTVMDAAMLRDFRLASQLLREWPARTPEQEIWLEVYEELAEGGRPWKQEELVSRAETLVKHTV